MIDGLRPPDLSGGALHRKNCNPLDCAVFYLAKASCKHGLLPNKKTGFQPAFLCSGEIANI